MSNDHIIKDSPFAPAAPKGAGEDDSSLAVKIGYGAPGSRVSDMAPRNGNGAPGQTEANRPNSKDGTPASADTLTIKPIAEVIAAKPGNDSSTASTAVKPLSADQASAPLILDAAYKQYLSATDGARKPMPKEDFDKISPFWEKALETNASIKPEQLAYFEYQALNAYGSQMIAILAMEKAGKKNPAELTQADMEKVSKEELQKAMSENENSWLSINAYFDKALLALKPEDRAKYVGAENALSARMSQVQAEATKTRNEALKAAGADRDKQAAAQSAFEATMSAAYLPAVQTRTDAQKALSPDLAKIIDARAAFLSDPKGIIARQAVENQQLINSYTQVDQARIQFAQALTLQSNPNDVSQAPLKDKATKLVSEAMKNPAAARLLENTQDGLQLLKALNLRTPEMERQAKLQEAQDKLFPELKLASEAAQLSSSSWTAASVKFKEAETAIDKEIMQRGQGKDLAESLEKVKAAADSMALQLCKALTDFKDGRRELPDSPGQDAAQKNNDARIVRAVMNGLPGASPPVPAMTQEQMLQALVGQRGPELQQAMHRVLTDSEIDLARNMAILAQKAQNVSLIRLNHSVTAKEFAGRADNDADQGIKATAAKVREEAQAVIKDVAKVDPATYNSYKEMLEK
jgi:hypothetical protein